MWKSKVDFLWPTVVHYNAIDVGVHILYPIYIWKTIFQALFKLDQK